MTGSRREMLSVAGGAGLLMLAGCLAEEDSEMTANRSSGGQGESGRPELPAAVADQDNATWQFVVDSLDYQNRALEMLLEEV